MWEWNEAIVLETGRGLRGGYYGSSLDGIDMHADIRDHRRAPTEEDREVGFRIAKVPESTTLSLLALGGLLVTRRRR